LELQLTIQSVSIRRGIRDTTLCDKVSVAGEWFLPCTPISSTNKTDATI
jgi:hypothetical protein